MARTTDDCFDLYGWRDAIASPAGPPSASTRHVLLTLSLYMTRGSKGVAWPSQASLAARTGLSLRTVKAAIADAEKSGWIVRGSMGRNSQGWRLTRYQGVIPAHVDLASKPWELDSAWKRGATAAPRLSADRPDVVQTVCNVVQITTERGANNGRNVVQPLHTNPPYESSNESSIEEGALTRTRHDPAATQPTTGAADKTAAKPNGGHLPTIAPKVSHGEPQPEPQPRPTPQQPPSRRPTLRSIYEALP
jgi:hypothetical protein